MTSDQMDASGEATDGIVVVPDDGRTAASADEAARALGRLTAGVFADGDPHALRTQVLELVTDLLPGCDAAGIVVRNGDAFETLACSHGLAREADEAQHRLHEGPAVLVTAGDGPVCVDDRASARWPAFATAAAELGVRGSAAHHLTVCAAESEPRPGALTLYSFDAQPFTADRHVIAVLAAHIGLLVSAAEDRRAAYQRERDLHRALASRDVIGQAKGVLMERQGLSPEQAFDVLRRASMRMNVKLRELAERIIQGDVAGL